ncbi:Uncharacterised protein [Klebsiella variicola]|uniref:Uncharacterized protein n=1 Tax=Klebsiella variicola TaxID=244366 RepID=A0A7H4MEG6_KLEVA|nr:Uncharacterised protein [Klebsiella variicola]
MDKKDGAGGRPGGQGPREDLLCGGGLDIVDANKTDFVGVTFRRNGISTSLGARMLAGALNQLILNIDFLIAVGGAGDLPGATVAVKAGSGSLDSP